MEKESLFARFKRHRTEKKINRLKELFAFLIESNKQEQASSVALLQQHQESFISSKLEKFEQNLTNSFGDLNTHVKELREVLTQVNESSVEGKEELGHRLSSLINNLEEKSSALQGSLAKTSQEETAHKIIRIAENLGTQLSGINQDSTDAFSALAQKIDNSLDVLKVSQESSVAQLQKYQESLLNSTEDNLKHYVTNSFDEVKTNLDTVGSTLENIKDNAAEYKNELAQLLSSISQKIENKSEILKSCISKADQGNKVNDIIKVLHKIDSQLTAVQRSNQHNFEDLKGNLNERVSGIKLGIGDIQALIKIIAVNNLIDEINVKKK